VQSETGRSAYGSLAFTRLLRQVANGKTSIALLDQALVSGANFATNILLARAFGLRDYGVYSLAWLSVLFANSLQYALIVTPMMSVGPKQGLDERPAYFGAVLLHELIFALVAALTELAAVMISPRFFPQWHIGRLAIPLSTATFAYLLQEFLRRYFFCMGKRHLALTSDVISYLFQVPLIYWIIRRPPPTISLALWCVAATSFLGFLPLMNWFGPVLIDTSSVLRVWKRHWKMARWLAPSAFMQWGAGNLFLMSAPFYYGAAAAAILRASQNIVAVAHVWFLGLDNVIPVEAARQMRAAGPDGMLKYIKRVSIQWGGVTLLFTMLIGLFPHFWLHLAYGSKYSLDGYVLRLYALLYLIIFMALPLRAGLLALEYTMPIFWAYPIMIAFSIALAGPFARRLGLTGVLLGMCFTQLISQAVVGGSLLIRIKRVRREISGQLC